MRTFAAWTAAGLAGIILLKLLAGLVLPVLAIAFGLLAMVVKFALIAAVGYFIYSLIRKRKEERAA